MIEDAIAHGTVNAEGKSDAELRQAIADIVTGDRKHVRLLFAVDHTPTLRKLGRRFENSGQAGLAAMMYATWVEHILNQLIALSVTRRGWTDDRAKQMIRDSSVHAKLRWLLPLLGYPEIHDTHATRLGKLAEMRNQFVHYKWNYTDLDDEKEEPQADLKFLESCRPSLTYLARYNTRARSPVSPTRIRRLVG